MPAAWSYLKKNVLPKLRRVELTIGYGAGNIVEQRTMIPKPKPAPQPQPAQPAEPYVVVDEQVNGIIVEMPDRHEYKKEVREESREVKKEARAAERLARKEAREAQKIVRQQEKAAKKIAKRRPRPPRKPRRPPKRPTRSLKKCNGKRIPDFRNLFLSAVRPEIIPGAAVRKCLIIRNVLLPLSEQKF